MKVTTGNGYASLGSGVAVGSSCSPMKILTDVMINRPIVQSLRRRVARSRPDRQLSLRAILPRQLQNQKPAGDEILSRSKIFHCEKRRGYHQSSAIDRPQDSLQVYVRDRRPCDAEYAADYQTERCNNVNRVTHHLFSGEACEHSKSCEITCDWLLRDTHLRLPRLL